MALRAHPLAPAPDPPSDPRRSAVACLLFCFLDAVGAGDASGELALLEVLMAGMDEDFSGLAWSDRHRQLYGLLGAGRLSHSDMSVAAAVRSELQRQAAVAAGLLGDVEHWLWRAGIELSRPGRELLQLPAGQALDELIGWEDVDGWHPGRAALEPQEQAAFRLSMEIIGDRDDDGRWIYHALEPWEIAKRMTRRRGDIRLALSVETVDKYLCEGRAKVRAYLLPRPVALA